MSFFLAFTYTYTNNSLSIYQHLEQVKLLLTHLLTRNFFRSQLDENIVFHKNILDAIHLLYQLLPPSLTISNGFFFLFETHLFHDLFKDVLQLGICVVLLCSLCLSEF